MIRRAIVYQRNEKLFVHAQSKLRVAAWIASPPFLAVDEGAGVEVKGLAVKQALAASVEGVPPPESYKKLFAPIYKLSGTRTWAQFCKSAVSCHISQTGEVLTLRPSVHRGTTGVFEPKTEGIVELHSPSEEEIGLALVEVLASSE